jgi:hypothetical protein
MGNALSEEEQEQIMEEAYNLEDPGADKVLNSGTSAPNCQPKHTKKEAEQRNGGLESKRQHPANASSSSLSSQQEQEISAEAQQKKLSYFQMAKLGYQELVNAIIRPPRADYKVRAQIRRDSTLTTMLVILRRHFFVCRSSPLYFRIKKEVDTVVAGF